MKFLPRLEGTIFRPADTHLASGVFLSAPRLIWPLARSIDGNPMEWRHTEFDLCHGDCVEGMDRLEAGSVDVAVTSPPYNLGIQYSRFRDDTDRSDYLDWSVRWATALRRILKPDGALYLNVGSSPSCPLLPHQLVLRLSDLFVLQNTIHWVKSIAIESLESGPVTVGHFKPINSPRFLTDCHEYIFHFTKNGHRPIDRLAVGVPYTDKSNITRWGHTQGRDKRCRGNNWFIPYPTIRNRRSDRPHPATFPTELATRCLRLHGVDRESVVIDPFLGLGHSALAAYECGVKRFIGFEIDETYLSEARSRLPQELFC